MENPRLAVNNEGKRSRRIRQRALPKVGAAVLAPIEGKRLSDGVYDRLLSLIGKGILQPGDRLWPEREMADSLRVSRQCVREALNQAKLLGLIEIRPGHGAYVKSIFPASTADFFSTLLEREPGRVLEFLRIRKLLEGWSAAEAATNATPSDIRHLADCVRRIKNIAEKKSLLGDTDVAFHIAIAEAAHSVVMTHLISLFRTTFQYVLQAQFVTRDPSRTQFLVAQHVRIFNAIRSRNSAAAKKAMLMHLEHIEADIRRYQAEILATKTPR
jgi:GntR family transcriptional repressor for pyruvate dehydrogenase complex